MFPRAKNLSKGRMDPHSAIIFRPILSRAFPFFSCDPHPGFKSGLTNPPIQNPHISQGEFVVCFADKVKSRITYVGPKSDPQIDSPKTLSDQGTETCLLEVVTA